MAAQKADKSRYTVLNTYMLLSLYVWAKVTHEQFNQTEMQKGYELIESVLLICTQLIQMY